MTHCNAGALATCGWGTATAPLFLAHAEGLPLHVWVSETRPRLQGANLTAWEMRQRGIPHTLFVDGASGAADAARRRRHRHRRRRPRRRATATSATRSAPTTRRSPRTTTACRSTSRCRRRRSTRARVGRRDPDRDAQPRRGAGDRRRATATGRRRRCAIAPAGTRAVNYAFDVTPARLVTGLITERGIAAAERDGAGRAVSRALCDDRSGSRTRRCATRDRRDGARDERAGHQPRQVGQRQRALAQRRLRRLPDHADRAAVRGDRRRTTSSRCRSTAQATRSARGCRRPSGASTATSTRARRRRRDRPRALAVRHHARLPRPRHPGVPLHGRGRRRRDIRCAPYATFGTQALSDHAVAALAGRRACLLAHHGMIATAASLAAARWRWRSRSRRWPRCTGARCRSASRRLLSDDEMRVVLEKFATYGQPRPALNDAPRPPCDSGRERACPRRAGVFRTDALDPRRGTPADSPTASARRRRTSPAMPRCALPAQQLARARDVGVAGRRRRPAGARRSRTGPCRPRRRLERAHHLEHRVARARCRG